MKIRNSMLFTSHVPAEIDIMEKLRKKFDAVVIKPSWPDLLVISENGFYLVEVKNKISNSVYSKLTNEQKLTIEILRTLGIDVKIMYANGSEFKEKLSKIKITYNKLRTKQMMSKHKLRSGWIDVLTKIN